MIVFVAPFPEILDKKDGFAQRVSWVDSLVDKKSRVYLEVSFRKYWFLRRYSVGNATVFKLNAVVHFFFMAYLFRKASVVYVHSVYEVVKALPAYWLSKPVTDLHGVVPEELLYMKRYWSARVFGLLEKLAVKRSASVIHVTVAMRQHYEWKYGRRSLADRVISILPKLADVRGELGAVLTVERKPDLVIYAGGLQVWQNVDLMIQAAAEVPEYNFLFLSGQASEIKNAASAKNIQNISCFSVESDDVANYYLTATYGLILRDESLVNRVACPTKLVEYLYWGVIPIILTPNIGDFLQLGLQFILLSDFCAGRIPNSEKITHMRVINRQIVEKLRETCNSEIAKLSLELNRDN